MRRSNEVIYVNAPCVLKSTTEVLPVALTAPGAGADDDGKHSGILNVRQTGVQIQVAFVLIVCHIYIFIN